MASNRPSTKLPEIPNNDESTRDDSTDTLIDPHVGINTSITISSGSITVTRDGKSKTYTGNDVCMDSETKVISGHDSSGNTFSGNAISSSLLFVRPSHKKNPVTPSTDSNESSSPKPSKF